MEAVNIIRKGYREQAVHERLSGSQPIYIVGKERCDSRALKSGVNVKTAFCGPCFGAGDIRRMRFFDKTHHKKF